MTCRSSFTLKGLEEYLEVIAQAGQDVDQAAENAVVAGGDVILDGLWRRVPRDTGYLAETLDRTEPERNGNFVFVEVGMPRDAPSDVARYGNVQEYGSASTPAQPYMRPTFDEDKGKMRKAQRASLEADGIL
jgi:HK97 gp10 family phage protein